MHSVFCILYIHRVYVYPGGRYYGSKDPKVATPNHGRQIAHFRTKRVIIFVQRELQNGWSFGPRTYANPSVSISISRPHGCGGVAAPFLQR